MLVMSQRAHSVQAYAEAHHIVLVFRMSHDTGCIEYVPQRAIWQRIEKALRRAGICVELHLRIFAFVGAVGCGKM